MYLVPTANMRPITRAHLPCRNLMETSFRFGGFIHSICKLDHARERSIMIITLTQIFEPT